MPIGNFTNLKGRKRLATVAAHGAASLMVPALNILVSLAVVRWASRELWGDFVEVMLVVNLCILLLNWGNKDYLLRGFATDPAGMGRNWQEGLKARALLLPIGAAALWLMPVSQPYFWLAILWMTAAFIYQSFEVVILYRKKFIRTVIAEVMGFGVLAGHYVLLEGEMDLEALVRAFAMAFSAKALLMVVWVGKEIKAEHRQVEGKSIDFLKGALPFFLLGLSGMINSRTDLYCVALYFGDEELGKYQVLISMLVYVQALSNFILLPFVRNIYRMKTQSIRKMSWIMSRWGGVFMLLTLPPLYAVYVHLFGFDLTPGLVIAGMLFVLPVFGYLPLIYELYKRKETQKVLWLNGAGIVLNLVGNLLLLPRFGITGALVSSAITQWILWGLFWWAEKNGSEN